MKMTRLVAFLFSLASLALFAADASAMYNPATGTWLQRDPGPGGMMAAPRVAGGPATGGGFLPRDQYADGLNLYQYVRSNPQRQIDPLGLWTITRMGNSTALAKTDNPKDTVESLASLIHLDATQWKDWLQPDNPKDPKSYSIQTRGNEHPACGKFKIPNTILAAWAGWEGLGQDFGKFYVMWGKDTGDLRSRGFAVIEKNNEKAAVLLSEIKTRTNNHTLHGFLFWGHGGRNGLTTKESENSSTSDDYWMNYSDVRSAEAYKLGFVMVYACTGEAACDPNSGNIMSPNGVGWGGHLTIVPMPFPGTGPTIAKLNP